MRKKSHWRLAKYLMRENHRPAIAMMFKIGSIAPDFMVRSMIQGHSYDTTLPRVKRRLEMLEASGRWNLVSAYRVGYVTHYLADYFTAPHNNHGDFNFRTHCIFEKQQLQMLRKHLDDQWWSDKDYREYPDLMNYIKTMHDDYLRQVPAVSTDCRYITNVTEQFSHYAFSLFNERQAKAIALAETGESLIKRGKIRQFGRKLRDTVSHKHAA